MSELGTKALEILRVAATPVEQRAAAYEALYAKFARKAVYRKSQELQKRGYLKAMREEWSESWLTDKGRHALELSGMRG